MLLVLGCGAQQGNATDVDQLNGISAHEGWSCDGRHEEVQSVQIADDDGD